MSEEKYRRKMARKALVQDREDYRMAVCECHAYMNHRPRCPMSRPSRSPNFGKTPWNYSHGDGLGNHDKDEHERIIREEHVVPYCDEEIAKFERDWESLPDNHRLKIWNRNFHG